MNSHDPNPDSGDEVALVEGSTAALVDGAAVDMARQPMHSNSSGQPAQITHIEFDLSSATPVGRVALETRGRASTGESASLAHDVRTQAI